MKTITTTNMMMGSGEYRSGSVGQRGEHRKVEGGEENRGAVEMSEVIPEGPNTLRLIVRKRRKGEGGEGEGERRRRRREKQAEACRGTRMARRRGGVEAMQGGEKISLYRSTGASLLSD
eukprot:763244-Hanusia_phi.AAC.1